MKLLVLISCFFLFPGIYDLELSMSNGETIKMSDFKGKMVLVVNTASGSRLVSQLSGLESLYQKYKDRLVIIACPSNSFGHEPLNDKEIAKLMQENYNVHFLLAAKTDVAGSSRSAIYKWLGEIRQNGVEENTVAGDFHKYLINKDGKLVGFFAGQVLPDDALLNAAILEEVH